MADPIFRVLLGRLRTGDLVALQTGSASWKIASEGLFGIPAAGPSVLTATITEEDDTLSSTVVLSIVASLSVTEADDTLSSTLAVLLQASVNVTEDDDTLSSTVTVLVQAAVNVTEDDDTLVGTLVVTSGGGTVGIHRDITHDLTFILVRDLWRPE